jgi:hypothetical protein
MVKIIASVRNVFRSNKAGQESLPSEVVDLRGKLQEEDRTGMELTFTDDSSGGSGQETQSAGSTENSIRNRTRKGTAESLGAAQQNKSNSSSGITSKLGVDSGETFLSPKLRTSEWVVFPSNNQYVVAPQQDLEMRVDSAIIADYSTNISLSKSLKIPRKSPSRHKHVLNVIDDDDDRSMPTVDFEHSTSSFDKRYYENSTLPLTKSPKQASPSSVVGVVETRLCSFFMGASHSLLDSSIPKNAQDELFEQLYEMDLNDDEEFGALYFSNDIPSHSGKEGSKRKSRKGVADNIGMEASVRSTRTGDEKKEGSKRKSKKEGSSQSTAAEKGSKKKSSKSLIDTTEDSKHKSRSSRSKSREQSKSKPRKAEKEGSKRKSRSLHVRGESTNHGEGNASFVSPTNSSPDGDIADSNSDDSMLSMGSALCKSPIDTRPLLSPGGTRNRSLGPALPNISDPPVCSPDGVVDGDDDIISKSKPRTAEKEGSKHKSRSLHVRGKSTNPEEGDASFVGPTSRPDGDVADNNFDDRMLSMGNALCKSPIDARPLLSPGGTRNRSMGTSLPSIFNPPVCSSDGVVDGDDDIKSQAFRVEKPRKSRDRSKSTHKRKSSKPLVEGLHQEVEQLKKELSEAWLIANDFAMNQKKEQFIFESTKKELDLLKLEQLDAEEAKQEHERVEELSPEAIRNAEEIKEALQAERVKLSHVSVAYARLKLEHYKAKEAAGEVEQLREQLSISKRESEERAGTQKQERSAFAALVTELTQLKVENEKAEAASEEVDKLREQLSEAFKKVEAIEEARKEDKMMLAKSTRELAEFQMDQETSMSNINHYAEIVRVNDVRISSLEAGLKNKDLIILEAKGIVEALDSALQAANQRNVSQEFDDFQENYRRHIMTLEAEIDAFHTAEDQQYYEESGRAKHENERAKEEVDRLKRDHEKELESAHCSLEVALRRVELLEAEIQNSCETREKLEERLTQENENLRKALEDLEHKHSGQVATTRNELKASKTKLASTITELMEEEYDARNQELEQEKEKLAKAELQVERLEKDSAEAATVHRAGSEQSEKKILILETRVVDRERAPEEIEAVFREEVLAEFQRDFPSSLNRQLAEF